MKNVTETVEKTVMFNGEPLCFTMEKIDSVGTSYKEFKTENDVFKKYTTRRDEDVYVNGRMKYVADENNVLVSWKI